VTLTFDLLTLKSVWESHVSCGTSVPSFVLNGLSVFDLGPIYAKGTDGQTDDRRRSLQCPAPAGSGHNNHKSVHMTKDA